jgi:predicted amidophosphoribosyltransferase
VENVKISKVVYINNCNHCGKALRDEWKFCPYCKIQVETFGCSYCGQEIRSIWNYCPNCKNEVKTELKNKQRVDQCNEWLRDILKSR